MAQSTPTNLYCSRASFRCAYMHHIEKYVFQQETVAPGLGLLLKSNPKTSSASYFRSEVSTASCLGTNKAKTNFG